MEEFSAAQPPEMKRVPFLHRRLSTRSTESLHDEIGDEEDYKNDENYETDDKNCEHDGENDENGGLHKRVTVLGTMFGKVLLPWKDNASRMVMMITMIVTLTTVVTILIVIATTMLS